MKPTFKFIDETISHDTIETLESLLDRAKRGEVLGIAYSVMNKKRNFNVDVTGELGRSPVFALGTLLVLMHCLLKRVVG